MALLYPLLCYRLTPIGLPRSCLLYTSDAADERSSVDLGGRRIIKKKNRREVKGRDQSKKKKECKKVYKHNK